MEIKRTITSIFMVPTLKISKERMIANGFINGYSKDANRDIQYEDAVYLLFQPKDLDKFREFLDSEYERTKSVIDDYDYEDGYVVVVYKLDPDLKLDFELIRQGKYSRTSKKFKTLFPEKSVTNVNGLKSEKYTLSYHIFNKSTDMIDYWEDKLGVAFDRNQEVWHMFFEEEETLNLNKLKENV